MDSLHSRWPRLAIGVHLLVVALASWHLGGSHAKSLYAFWATISGVSLFVLTGLIHEASHHLLSRSIWLNELAGNLAGWMLLTPLSAYRAFHLTHHQKTNREGDPNAPLNSRWMLAAGSIVYAGLIHLHAWKKLRGRALRRYLVEVAAMTVFLAVLAVVLPRALRERAWWLPLLIVMILQNIRIVTAHLDLPSGRYHDTWQLVLPGWLSGWLLHFDHHLEHHLRPGLHRHELSLYRARLIACEPKLELHRKTFGQYFRDVFLKRRIVARRPPSGGAPGTPKTGDAPALDAGPSPRQRLRADLPAVASARPDSLGPRYHGLDALRGTTMVLVVVLHAALAYAVLPIPNLIWAVRDPAAHPAFDLLCWWTLSISSLFYLMSGFFAAELCDARGLLAFLVNRAQRIALPFLVAGLFILPATYLIWAVGWLISGQCTPREFLRMKFHARGYQQNLYGPAHLWSLEYLAIMLLAFSIFVWLRGSMARRLKPPASRLGWLDRGLASPWKPLLLAMPTTLILWAGHRHVGLDAIMDRINTFVPEPFRLVHNVVFFMVGVRLHRFRDNLESFAVHGWTYLALSVPVFACRAFLIHRDLVQSVDGPRALALAVSMPSFPGSSPSGCSAWAWRCSIALRRPCVISPIARFGSI